MYAVTVCVFYPDGTRITDDLPVESFLLEVTDADLTEAGQAQKLTSPKFTQVFKRKLLELAKKHGWDKALARADAGACSSAAGASSSKRQKSSAAASSTTNAIDKRPAAAPCLPICGACREPLQNAEDMQPCRLKELDPHHPGQLHCSSSSKEFCSKVWMPEEGYHFCGPVCIARWNAIIEKHVGKSGAAMLVLRQTPTAAPVAE